VGNYFQIGQLDICCSAIMCINLLERGVPRVLPPPLQRLDVVCMAHGKSYLFTHKVLVYRYPSTGQEALLHACAEGEHAFQGSREKSH